MSLKKNVVANYIGQFYLTVIGIVMVPVYVKYMGAEAYGLVGFFTLMQSWFQLLDVGLTPTLVRETARFQGGAVDALGLRRLLRALEGFFIAIAFIGGLFLALESGHIARGWLKVQHLSLIEVQQSIVLMAIIVALRWICGLYRGAINGFERLVWLNSFNVIIASARFLLVILVFRWVGTRPVHFFGFQLLVAGVEVVTLISKTYRLLPASNCAPLVPWDWKPLRASLGFSLSIAFTGSIWVFVTQTDKLVLSKLLPLTEYAYFSLAILVASGILVVIGPVSGVLLPRLARLVAEGDEGELVALYRRGTQAVAVAAVPAALMLAFFPEQVLWAWTGRPDIAHQAAPVLRLYALGNGFMALAAFPYYIQFAKGDLKLHLLGNIMFVVVLIPSLIWAVGLHGATGAGWVWLGSNILSFLLWTPVVHHRFLKDIHALWLLTDIVPIVAGPLVLGYILHGMVIWPGGRSTALLVAIVLGSGLLVTALLGSSYFRARVKDLWIRHTTGVPPDLKPN
ncbi:lipopolysaccharide biosynthesis protein [Geothrix campi]|uniref:lipopolysaccharide biosynthesis protein n=1 Tax=Geothrix campi TaxID=2966450 RepID=UPI002147FF6D|nr:oligosaccharide flippase family protein [Geothrix sp. SG10]